MTLEDEVFRKIQKMARHAIRNIIGWAGCRQGVDRDDMESSGIYKGYQAYSRAMKLEMPDWSTYVYSAVRYGVIDTYKKGSKEYDGLFRVVGTDTINVFDLISENRLISQGRRGQLDKHKNGSQHLMEWASSKLSGEYKDIFLDYYVEGLTFEEIAEKRQSNFSLVQHRHTNALDKIRLAYCYEFDGPVPPIPKRKPRSKSERNKNEN